MHSFLLMGVHLVGGAGSTRVAEPIAFDVDTRMSARLPDDAPFEDAAVRCRKGVEMSGEACVDCARFRGFERESGGTAMVWCHFSDGDPVTSRMTPASELVTVSPSASLEAADELARAHQLHHLLVVDAGRLMGVVCRCELIPAAPDHSVAERLGEDLFVVASNASLGEALAAMRALGVGCLPVLADNLLVGILTRGDLRRVGVPRELLGAGRCCAGVAD